MQSNKRNVFTAVSVFMTNQNLKGVQRSERASFNQYLCNIPSTSTKIEKEHKRHPVPLKGNTLCVYI